MSIETVELGELYNKNEFSLFSIVIPFHYTNLNVDTNASKSEIKKSYYKLSLKYHPDKCDDSNIERNTKKFRIINESYKCLSDDSLRSDYDITVQLIKSNIILIRRAVNIFSILKYAFKLLATIYSILNYIFNNKIFKFCIFIGLPGWLTYRATLLVCKPISFVYSFMI